MLETGIGLLHRLRVYELAARVLVTGAQLLEVHQADEQGLMPMKELSLMISEISSALISLAEVVAEPWSGKDTCQAAIPNLATASGGLVLPCANCMQPSTTASLAHMHLLVRMCNQHDKPLPLTLLPAGPLFPCAVSSCLSLACASLHHALSLLRDWQLQPSTDC